jgi:hypothetical protein
MAHKAVMATIVAALPGLVQAGDYVGTLRAPQSTLTPPGMYSFAAEPAVPGLADPLRLKLGYKPSRYFAVEGEVLDFGPPDDPFANPASLAGSFRSTGVGVDTIAMLPLWRFSLYGRMGAYRGDGRGVFGSSHALLSDGAQTRGTRLRYGMGLRYDFTQSLGVRAEFERHSPLGAPLASDVDAGDQVSVGLSWRF